MTDFERYLEDARIQSEVDEVNKTEALIEMIERQRQRDLAARIKRRMDDPMLMWQIGMQDKLASGTAKPKVRMTVPPCTEGGGGTKCQASTSKQEDPFWSGFQSGVAIAVLTVLFIAFVAWVRTR